MDARRGAGGHHQLTLALTRPITLAMLNKLLLTIVAVALVWFGFKYWSRMALRAERERQREVPPGGDGAKAEAVEDMVECRICGSYVPARRPRRCGRADCPF